MKTENGYIKLPDLDFLKMRYIVDFEAGEVFYRTGGCGVRAGWRAGSLDKNGYYRMKINGRLYLQHRIIYYMAHGVDPMDSQIDHANQNRSDNRLSNLRLCTSGQNRANSGLYKNSSTGFRGVYWHSQSNKYRSEINVEKATKHLGYFHCPIEAAKAYDIGSRKYYGEFAFQNLSNGV